LTRYGT